MAEPTIPSFDHVRDLTGEFEQEEEGSPVSSPDIPEPSLKERRRKQKKEKRKAILEHRKEEKAELAEQQSTMKNSQKKRAKLRIKYLLKQSEIFTHFARGATPQTATRKRSDSVQGSMRRRRSEREEDTEMLKDAMAGTEVSIPRLTCQPALIENGEMRIYQLEALNWMISLYFNGVGAILADEMGLGKTLQSISLLAFLMEREGITGPHLVVAPKSTLGNWMNELKRWCPSLRPFRFHGSKEERAEMTNKDTGPIRAGLKASERQWDVLVTSYEMTIIEKATLSKIPWRVLILDEAHRVKNENSKLSLMLRTFKIEQRLLLTGTPLQNNLHELWALLNFLMPDVFSSSEDFEEWFNFDSNDEKMKEKLVNQLHRVLRPFMLRRLKIDVERDMPPKKETFVYVGLTKMQKDLYRSVLKKQLTVLTGSDKGQVRLLNTVMQLRKVCNHPYLFDGVEDRSLDPMGDHLYKNCGKMQLLDKLLSRLKKGGHRVLLFSQMTRLLDILEDFCFMKKYNYCRIDGSSSYEEREEGIDSFNAEGSDKFIFLLSTRAGGLGVNLHTADVVILFDSDWNPQVDLQAQDRAHRIGQTRPVNVYRLITSNTIEEKVVERAMVKLRMDAVMIQSGRLAEKSKALSKNEMLEMIRYGADNIIQTSGDDDEGVCDADIEKILSEGAQRTEEITKSLEEKLSSDGSNLLDFKLETSSTMNFEGVDYSDARKIEDAKWQEIAMKELTSTDEEIAARRERAQKRSNFNENKMFRDMMVAGGMMPATKPSKPKIPSVLRLPRMDDWQFYNRERLLEINSQGLRAWHEHVDGVKLPKEEESSAAVSPAVDVAKPQEEPVAAVVEPEAMDVAKPQEEPVAAVVEPEAMDVAKPQEEPVAAVVEPSATVSPAPDSAYPSPSITPGPSSKATALEMCLPADLIEERERLLAEGFNWVKRDYLAFVDGLKKCGRFDKSTVFKRMLSRGKELEEIKRYWEVFWAKGSSRLPDWDKIMTAVERTELRLATTAQVMASGKIKVMRGLLSSVAPVTLATTAGASTTTIRLNSTSSAPLTSALDVVPREIAGGNSIIGDVYSAVGAMNRAAKQRKVTGFSPEEDSYMLCFTLKLGYGSWTEICKAMKAVPVFRFSSIVRGMVPADVRRRVDILLRQCSKENDDVLLRGARKAFVAAEKEEKQRLRKLELQNRLHATTATSQKVQGKLVLKRSSKSFPPEYLPGIAALMAENNVGYGKLEVLIFTKYGGALVEVPKAEVKRTVQRLGVYSQKTGWTLKPEHEGKLQQTMPAEAPGDLARLTPAKPKKKPAPPKKAAKHAHISDEESSDDGEDDSEVEVVAKKKGEAVAKVASPKKRKLEEITPDAVEPPAEAPQKKMRVEKEEEKQ